MTEFTHGTYPFQDKTLYYLLYLDGLEICNPLGSKAKMHKIVAVYYVIMNIPYSYRQKMDAVNILAICPQTVLTSVTMEVFARSLVRIENKK